MEARKKKTKKSAPHLCKTPAPLKSKEWKDRENTTALESVVFLLLPPSCLLLVPFPSPIPSENKLFRTLSVLFCYCRSKHLLIALSVAFLVGRVPWRSEVQCKQKDLICQRTAKLASGKSGRKKAHKHELFALVNVQMALGQTAGCPRVNRATKSLCVRQETQEI